MNHYQISAGNPESTDWSLSLDHENVFNEDEFNTIAEDAIVYALEKELKEHTIACVSSMNPDYVLEYLISKGFTLTPEKITARYYLEPYWGKELIKSGKLLQWINREKINQPPEYMSQGQ